MSERLPFVPTWGLLVKFILLLHASRHSSKFNDKEMQHFNQAPSPPTTGCFVPHYEPNDQPNSFRATKIYPKTFNFHEANCLLVSGSPPQPSSTSTSRKFLLPSELFVLDHHFLREWNSEGLLQISSSLPPNKAPEPPQKTGREWSKFWRRNGYIRIYTFLLPAKWVKIQRILPFLNSGPTSLQGHKVSKWSRLQGLEISKSCFYPLVN